MSIIQKYKIRSLDRKEERYSFEEYLDNCKQDHWFYSNVFERMVKGFGKMEILDTAKDERLGRIYFNKKIKTYPEVFKDFFGMEEIIEAIVGYFTRAGQGLPDMKKILYLLGPVGGGKSSSAEELKRIVQKEPFYTLEARNFLKEKVLGSSEPIWEISPLYESALGLIDYERDSADVENEYKIDRFYLKHNMSPWAAERFVEVNGDISQFRVVKLYPSLIRNIGVTKVEPGDDNNQDVSTLIGKLSIAKVGDYEQSSPDAYSWKGGLNVTTQGLLEFVEMFKAPLKTLHPLLTATAENSYNGSEQFGANPYQGCVLAHSNEQEWKTFKEDKKNEAFLDRIVLVQAPYCLRTTEEKLIYQKILSESKLKNAPCAPETLETMARFSVQTRLVKPDNSSTYLKMEVYDGNNLKNKHPSVKTLEEYKTAAGVDEGMDGSSPRFAFEILAKTFNYDVEEFAANPVHLMTVLRNRIKQERFAEEKEKSYLSIVDELGKKYFENFKTEIQTAFIDDHDTFCQNAYERYVQLADHWLEDKDFRDPDTDVAYNRDSINKELEKTEKPAGIGNPKEFRNEIVKFFMRMRANNGGKSPRWDSYEKIKEVIQVTVFSDIEKILPVITAGKKANNEQQEKHDKFMERMLSKGYTPKQTKLLVEWYIQNKNNG